MKFNWDGFTAINFVDYCVKMENCLCEEDDYVGSVRVGNLCFDILTRHDGNFNYSLEYDLYVGGEDTGYGYSNKNGHNDYPYDYASGGEFKDTCISMTYDDFRTYAEKEFEFYINERDKAYGYSLVNKASEELNIW